MRVEIPLCVWKSYSACRNHNLVSVEILFVLVPLEITLCELHSERVALTLCVYKSHSVGGNCTKRA
jgi:hypothetical protein